MKIFEEDKLGKRANLKTGLGWVPKDAKPEDPCTVEDFASAMIRYDNGAVTHLETSYSLNGEPKISRQLFGTKAGMDFDNGIKLYSECNDFLADIDIKTENYMEGCPLFEAEINHFVDCILNGTACKSTAEDGIVIMQILDAIYLSAETGHEVILE